jgi:protein O-GlcNAc transferase
MTVSANELDQSLAQALVRHRAGDFAAAGAVYDSVLAQNPDHAEALHLKGILTGQQGDPDEALVLLDRAIAIKPDDPRILANRAKLRLDRGDVIGAVEDYEGALALKPEDCDLHFNAAGARAVAGQLEGAMEHLEQAIAIEPRHARALANLGNMYRQSGRVQDSRDVLMRAVDVAPGDPEIQHSLGATLAYARDYEAAAARFRRALELDKGFIRTAAQLFFSNLHACDWRDRAKLIGNFERLIDSDSSALRDLSPLIALFLPLTQAQLNRVSDARAASIVKSERGMPPPACVADAKDKLHVAYLSADLGRHPVGYLTADLFARHDRDGFTVSAVALAPPDGSDVQERIADGVDQVVDVSRMSAGQAAGRIRELGVDILVDLGGFTRGARPEVLAERAAPLQIGWLGYCGSSGGLNDVILADERVVPAAEHGPFSEAVAALPGSFMPLNNDEVSSGKAGTRADHGLPETGFVFCAFNTPTKIDPETFAAWMDILKQVDRAVLWLREHVPTTTRNLCVAAEKAGVDPARLVFAPPVAQMQDHLARHHHADLFLDTFIYGAHSTAADAIAMGLPVLTRAGRAMPARVGASLCHAFGLEDLIADTTEAYVWTAVELSRDPDLLRERKARLVTSLSEARGNDVFVRKLESAYRSLWKLKSEDGIAPGRLIRIETD